MNTPGKTRYTIKAYRGDIVMCRNGHELYELLADIEPGGIVSSSMFRPIGNAQVPEKGTGINNCHICGEPWITKEGSQGGGWRLCNVRSPD